MACNAVDIPNLSFPRDEIIEIIPASYNNEATRIAIPGLPKAMILSSPQEIHIPVPSSECITPEALETPKTETETPPLNTPRNEALAPSKPGQGQHLLVERAPRN